MFPILKHYGQKIRFIWESVLFTYLVINLNHKKKACLYGLCGSRIRRLKMGIAAILALLILMAIIIFYISMAIMMSRMLEVSSGRFIRSKAWWLDVYVYIPRLNETGGFEGYQPALNALLFVFGRRYNQDFTWSWTMIASGYANTWDEGNKAYRAHLEFTVQYAPYPNIPLMVVGVFPEVVEGEDGALMVKNTWWGSLFFDVFPDDEDYQLLFNRSKESYFNFMNEFEKRLESRNIEDVLPNVLLPICNSTSPYYDETTCNYYRSYKQSLLDYWNERHKDLTFYVDDHTLRLYLYRPDITLPPIHTGFQTSPSSEHQGVIGPIIGSVCPTPGYRPLYKREIARKIPLVEPHSMVYMEGSSKSIAYIDYNSAYMLSASISVSTQLGLPIFQYETGGSTEDLFRDQLTLDNRYDEDDAVYLGVHYRLEVIHVWHPFRSSSFHPPACMHWFIAVLVPVETSGYLAIHIGPLMSTSDYGCHNIIAILSNDTDPRVGSWSRTERVEISLYHSESFGFNAELGEVTGYIEVTAHIRSTFTTRVDGYSGHGLSLKAKFYFYDSGKTKPIRVIYVTLTRHSSGIPNQDIVYLGSFLFRWCIVPSGSE